MRIVATGLVALSVFGLLGMACANADAPAPSVGPPDHGDATLPPDDGNGELDAGIDGDADVEAGPRDCSTFGFCPTALPPGDHTLKAVWGDRTGIVWAVTSEGAVLRWNGTAWKVHASDLGALSVIWGSSPTDIWIAGERGIQHGTGASSDALAFTPNPLPEEGVTVSAIWGTSASDLWAVGSVLDADGFTTHARAYHAEPGDAGLVWTLDPVSNGDLSAITHVWSSPGSGLWLAGSRPQADAFWLQEVVLLRKLGAETTFTAEALPDDPKDAPPYARIQAVAGGSVTDATVWMLGRSNSPGIWKGTSTNGGASFTWTYQRDGYPSDPPLTAVTGNGSDALWAVGEGGRVRHWNGTTWAPTAITTTTFPIVEPFYGVWSHGANEVWVVGKGMALRYDPTKAETGGAK